MTDMRTRLIFAAAAVLAVIAIASATASHYKLRRLESAVQKAANAADRTQKAANELEKRTYEYKQEIQSLETRIETLRDEAARQDAELRRIADDADSARRALDAHRKRTNGK